MKSSTTANRTRNGLPKQLYADPPCTTQPKKGKKPPVPGDPVEARLVVSRVLSEQGKVLAGR
ncbi:MAG: hypothetical protein R8K48_10540 [Gallionella sp.]